MMKPVCLALFAESAVLGTIYRTSGEADAFTAKYHLIHEGTTHQEARASAHFA